MFQGLFFFVLSILLPVILLKHNKKLFLKTLIISLWCCSIFIGIGYYYLNKNFTETDNIVQSVPYKQQSPDNAGILLNISGEETFVFLDFENENLTISLTPDFITENSIYGYSLDYKITGNVSILIFIVDYLGGIELKNDDSISRYTGVQIAEIFSTNNLKDFKKELITSICKKIHEKGIATNFFVNLIEMSETDISVPTCYFWADHINSMSSNLSFID